MGRRRLYYSADEKQAANRVKSKRSYDKHKETINEHRRKKYLKSHKSTRKKNQESCTNTMADTRPTTQSSPISIWLERADRVHARLQRITENNEIQFLHSVVEGFLKDHDKDCVYEHIVAIGKLQRLIYKFENEILTLAGMGLEYEKVGKITQHVCKVVRWLEEVLCHAMVDESEVDTMYVDRKFLFQQETS